MAEQGPTLVSVPLRFLFLEQGCQIPAHQPSRALCFFECSPQLRMTRTKSSGRVEVGEGGRTGWGGVEGWGENADNYN